MVLLKLLGGEHILPVRPGVFRIATRLVEGINRESAGGLDRLAAVAAVEHQPSAEAAGRRHATLVHDRIRPYGDELERRFGFAVGPFAPRNALPQVKVERRAAGERNHDGDEP